MTELSVNRILRELFLAGGSGSCDPRVEVLIGMTFDLMMEVQALRQALLRSELGAGGLDSAYGRAYRETALLTHDSTGPSDGLMKLLHEFYPRDLAPTMPSEPGETSRTWRECSMLRRMGASSEQVAAYQERAREMETYT